MPTDTERDLQSRDEGPDKRPGPDSPARGGWRRSWRKRVRRYREARAGLFRSIKRGVGRAASPLTSSMREAREWSYQRRKVTYPIIALVALGVAIILPFLGDWFELPQWMERATSGGALARFALFVLFALGLNVVTGFAGLLDLGYVAFWAIGAYTAGLLTGAAEYTKLTRIGEAGARPEWEPWMWGIILVALLFGVIAGIVLGSPVLRLRGDYLAIVTLGFGEIVRILANNLDNITVGPRGISSIPHPEIGGIKWGTLVDVKYYWLFLAVVVVWIIAIKALDNSRIGRAWVAIREDEVAAAAMGVPVIRMKLTAFAIGACTAGVGGVIYAEQVNFINPPTFNVLQSILIVSMVVVGGMGSIAGPILGAALVTLLPEAFRGFEEYRFFVFGIALVVVMIFRPQGLIPSRRRSAELHGASTDQQLYDTQRA